MKNVEVSDAAAARIAKILAREPGKTALRVSVEGGGCSGFSYKFDLVDERNEDDTALEKNRRHGTDRRIVAGPIWAARSSTSSTTSWANPFRSGIPIAVASCGCGTSFSI